MKWIGLVTGLGLFTAVTFWAWEGIREVVRGGGVSAGWLTLSIALMVGGEAIVGAGFARGTRLYGGRVTVFSGLRIHFLTAPARILPGFFGTTVGRVGLGARQGVGARPLIAASIIEPAASGIVSVALGLMFLMPEAERFGTQLRDTLGSAVPIAGIVILLVVAVLIFSTRRRLSGPHPSLRSLLGVLSLYAMAWVAFGGALVAQTAALGGSDIGIGFGSAVIAVSWLLGFLVIIVPGGLGVREGAMAVLLTPAQGFEVAAAVALLARIVWWTATGVVFVLGLLLGRFSSEGAQQAGNG